MRSSKLSQQEDSSSKILKELLLYGVSQKHSIVHLVLQNTPMQRAIEVPWNWENDLLKVNIKEYSNDETWFAEFSTIFDLLGVLTPAIIEPKQIIHLSC